MSEIVTMPKLGFDMAEGLLVRWVKKVGDPVHKGDVLAEIETDKATVEVESTYDGVVLQLLVEQSTSVPVGDPIAVIGAQGEKVEAVAKPKPKTPELPAGWPSKIEESQPVVPVAPVANSDLPAIASPLARKVARDNGLDLNQITGSGPNGRVIRKDVDKAIEGKKSDVVPQQPTRIVNQVDEAVPVNKLRGAIGRRMVDSKTSIPHFYVTHQFDASKMMQIRKEINLAQTDEQKISVNDFIIKATALALRRYPNINSSLSQTELVRHGSIHIGVAVSVEGGLLTVVVKNADQKSLSEISTEVKEMTSRVRQGKVKVEDIEGSTFSISNLGMFDVEAFTAIINPPEAAILAVASVHEAPIVENGELKVGQVFKATLSADHRITDGVEAAQFMQELARLIENPLLMLI